MACERAAASVPRTPQATVDTTPTAMLAVAWPTARFAFPFVPDPAKTPGATLDVTAADVCVSGYSKRVRNVPSAVKRQAYASYGVRTHEPGEYEVDHLISL